MPNEHILRRTVEVPGEETSALLTLQAAHHSWTMVNKVCEPVLDVRRVRTGCDQVQFNHVTTLNQAAIGVGHIARQEAVEITDRAHPSQTGDTVRLASEPGCTDTTAHLGHRQDQDFLMCHDGFLGFTLRHHGQGANAYR